MPSEAEYQTAEMEVVGGDEGALKKRTEGGAHLQKCDKIGKCHCWINNFTCTSSRVKRAAFCDRAIKVELSGNLFKSTLKKTHLRYKHTEVRR